MTWIACSPLRAFAVIFFVSFSIRLAILVSGLLPPVYFRPFGEIGRVAVSLARSGQFADPYFIPTGPTAHPTPIYAGLLGLIYSLLGVTTAAAYVRGLVAITAHSALYAMLPWLAVRFGLGIRAGILGGLAGALVPQQGTLEIVGGSDEPFPGIALALLSVAWLRRWIVGDCSAVHAVLLGAACGVALHLSPPLVTVLVAWMSFEAVYCRHRRTWLLLAAVCAAAGAVCIPWTWRNYVVLHGFLFIRSNFGLELRIANHDGADADIDVTRLRDAVFRHPSADLGEARLVRALGEAEYMRQARNEALEWILRNPSEFCRLTLWRVAHFWGGPLRIPWSAAATTTLTILAALGLLRAWPELAAPLRAALLIPLLTFPLVYYVVSYVGHYRAPLEWMLLLLAGAAVSHWFNSGKTAVAEEVRPCA
jgi:hypothetical protein